MNNNEEMVELPNGKKIPRSKVCYRPLVKKMEVPLANGEKVEKTIVSTSNRAYIKDEDSGALIRIGEKVNGKKAKKEKVKARKAARG